MYLRRRLLVYLRKLAESESWELADLARALMTVGLTLRYLYEARSGVGSKHRVFTAKVALNYLGHGTVRRGYSPRGSRGEWLTVHLPAGFLKKVDMWAHDHGRSRNDALSLFLQDGLFCYLSSYKRFLKATIDARNSQAAAGSHRVPGEKESSANPES